MTTLMPTVRHAARLVYKALHTTAAPVNDAEYRELLALYRADPAFKLHVQDVAEGLTLVILDVSERGLIVVPSNRESKFAVRMTDIRTGMSVDQRAAIVLAHVAIASVFFPTTDGLDDDNYNPPPVSAALLRDTLHSLSRRLKDASDLPADLEMDIAPGFELIAAMPVALPAGQRASTNSVVGILKLALTHMRENGLVRLDRDAEDDTAVTYTATHRLRVQLRELTMRRLYEISLAAIAQPTGV